MDTNQSIDSTQLNMPGLRLRRRRSTARMLGISVAVSVLTSAVIHVLVLLALKDVSLAEYLPWLKTVETPQQNDSEKHWVIVEPYVNLAKDSGTKHPLPPYFPVGDSGKTLVNIPEGEITPIEAKFTEPSLPPPVVDDLVLDNAEKEMVLTGVEVAKDPKDKLELLEFEPPKSDVIQPIMPDIDVNIALPEGQPTSVSVDRMLEEAGRAAQVPDFLAVQEASVDWSHMTFDKDADDESAMDFNGKFSPPSDSIVKPGVANPLVRGGLAGRPDGVEGGKGSGHAVIGVKVRIGAGMELTVPKIGDESSVAMEFTPMPMSDLEGLMAARSREGGDVRQEDSVPLDQFVNVRLRVSRDSYGGGYYEAMIEPNDKSVELNDVDKDVLFILDHSGSISGSRLQQFKEQTIGALRNLNAGDRFNMVFFANSSHWYFEDYVSPTKENKTEAESALRGLHSKGTTDVFGGVGPYISMGNGDLSRPLIVFVMTDGQSTIDFHRGVVQVDNTNDGEVLRKIAVANPGNVSIYPFSAGDDSNRVLLDFMARLNSGSPLHAQDAGNFHGALSQFMKTHMSMLVRNFRFIAEGGTGASIYPKTLPNLYRNEPLSIYGKFTAADDELVLTLLGYDAAGKLRNLVFRKRFADAEEVAPVNEKSGEASLYEQWMAQKTMHLLAEYVLAQGTEKANSPEQKARRKELNAALATISAFSKYPDLLK